jgi:hypothetical protein
MSRRLRVLAVLIAGTLVMLAGCSSPSVIPAESPDAGTQPADPEPEATPTAEAEPEPEPPPAVAPERRWEAGQPHAGIQVYTHTAEGGRPADEYSTEVLDYVVELGANGVGLTFPLYTDGVRATSVSSGQETPPPQVLATIVAAAHERGLRVMLRPVIDEENLAETPGEWRGTLRPPDLDAWFASYEDALMPFLEMAAESEVEEFVLAAELTSLQRHEERWAALADAAREVFPATLSYTFNWDGTDTELLPEDSLGIDLYYVVDAADDASPEEISAGLVAAMNRLPESMRERMVAQEVGIPGQAGMYRNPWYWGSDDPERYVPEIQSTWFAGACQAVQESGLQGVYFWMLDSSEDPSTVDPDESRTASFVGRAGEDAIRDCFESILGG